MASNTVYLIFFPTANDATRVRDLAGEKFTEEMYWSELERPWEGGAVVVTTSAGAVELYRDIARRHGIIHREGVDVPGDTAALLAQFRL